MEYSLCYLPLLCKQLLRGHVSPLHVRNWLGEARQDWAREVNMQRVLHLEWERHRLSRQEHALMQELLLLSREQKRSTDGALDHLNRYVLTRQRPEIVWAAARWHRAELARQRYLGYRGKFERMALEWRAKKPGECGRPTGARREGEFLSREELCSILRPATHPCLTTTAS